MKIDYQGHSNSIEFIVHTTGDCFKISNNGTSYELTHRRLPITVDIPTSIGRGRVSQVNMMAPLIEEKSPEAMIDFLKTFIRRRDLLRKCGYQQFEKWEWYGDGSEIVYQIPLESKDDLLKICSNFGFKRTTYGNIDQIARGRELVKVQGGRFAILFEATSSHRDYGTKTDLLIPTALSKRIGIDKTMCLGKAEIGNYGKNFYEYILGLLEKADMYVAEERWNCGITDEKWEHSQRTGVIRHSLDGELYQEQLARII